MAPSAATFPLQSIRTSFECHESVHTACTASDFGSQPMISKPSCGSSSNDHVYSTDRNWPFIFELTVAVDSDSFNCSGSHGAWRRLVPFHVPTRSERFRPVLIDVNSRV